MPGLYGTLTEKMAGTEQSQSKRDAILANNRTRKAGIPKSMGAQMMPPRAPDAEQEAAGFGACPAGLFLFLLELSDYGPILPLWNKNVYSVMWYI